MTYYQLAFLNSPLSFLTYKSDKQIKIGTKVLVQLARRKLLTQSVVVKIVPKPTFKCTTIDTILDEYYDNLMLKTAQFISSYYVCSFGEALSLYLPYKINHDTTYKQFNSTNTDITLSEEQQKSFDFTKQNKISLLFNNTGSGKTEIYIKAIFEILKQNKQAVMLMPEISLTPQMEIRLQKVFGDTVAIWHSKITKKKKDIILEKLSTKEIQLIAGARSALFLPYEDLGLIVVDEEHDESYKADKKPRINVKDIALYIGTKFNIQVILGSATPSMSSYTKVPFSRSTKTYFNTSKQIKFDNSSLGINDTIIQNIKQTLENNHQTIVFLPTRANFKYQICQDCGKSCECPFCSVGLSLHKNNRLLKCHYCNYTQQIVETCQECGGLIKNFRLGTAEVEEILNDIFKDKIIQRFDRDTIKTNKELKNILKQFNDNKIDILVGTQMLSKGHDYHNVTLAVILGIDSVLNMTSYKSREKALSLALQISGRSGRNGLGEVLIQTKNIDFFQQYLGDYEEFIKDELNCRQDIYPPFVRLARVIFSHQNAILAKQQLDKYVSIFKNISKDIELIGFKECGIFKISNKYRYELLLRSQDTKALINILHSIDTPLATIDMDTNF